MGGGGRGGRIRAWGEGEEEGELEHGGRGELLLIIYIDYCNIAISNPDRLTDHVVPVKSTYLVYVSACFCRLKEAVVGKTLFIRTPLSHWCQKWNLYMKPESSDDIMAEDNPARVDSTHMS